MRNYVEIKLQHAQPEPKFIEIDSLLLHANPFNVRSFAHMFHFAHDTCIALIFLLSFTSISDGSNTILSNNELTQTSFFKGVLLKRGETR